MNKIGFLISIMVLLFSCKPDKVGNVDENLLKKIEVISPTSDASFYILPNGNDLSAIPNQDRHNKLTTSKVALGKLLYFETGIAQNPKNEVSLETYSCSSCHNPEKGFTPGAIQGIADGGIGFGENGEGRVLMSVYDEDLADIQGIRPLSMLNLAYVTNTFWNGQFGANGVNEGTEALWSEENERTEVNHLGFEGLESQNIEGLALHRMNINSKVLDEYGYRELFDKAFPTVDQIGRYTFKTASFAISAYLRTLMTNEAPFQKYLKGDLDAMTLSQKRGADLFFGKAQCVNCHNGASLNNMDFFRLGTADMYASGGLATSPYDKKNLGRGGFTGNDDELYAFKVPQLYNVGDYASYFHGSSKTSLREVVKFKIAARSENPRIANSELSDRFHKITNITEDEIDNLVDFLGNGLRDGNLSRYVPTSLPSGNCFPNNDIVSRQQMGCE